MDLYEGVRLNYRIESMFLACCFEGEEKEGEEEYFPRQVCLLMPPVQLVLSSYVHPILLSISALGLPSRARVLFPKW